MTLALLEPTPETPEPKPLSVVRQELVLDYLYAYKTEFGEKCTEPFVKCLGTLRGTFEGTDEETGEIYITYPDREEWREELKKFFYKSKENWYRLNNRCTFFTFCKNYGRYNHHIPPKEEAKAVKRVTGYYCKGCKTNHPFDHYCEKA